jgi:hypothetical protein
VVARLSTPPSLESLNYTSHLPQPVQLQAQAQ